MLAYADCPSCKSRVYRPTLNAEGMVRCGNCRAVFAPPAGASVAPLPAPAALPAPAPLLVPAVAPSVNPPVAPAAAPEPADSPGGPTAGPVEVERAVPVDVGAAGAVLEPHAMELRAPVAAEEASAAADAPPDALPPPPASLPARPALPPLPPLGREMQGHSYGMLRTFAYGFIVISVLGYFGSIVLQYLMFSALGNVGGGGQGGIGFIAGPLLMQAVSGLVQLGRDVVIGLAFLRVMQALSRFDAAATFVAWRSGGLVQMPELPRGAALHFMLPLSVSGGVLVILGGLGMFGDPAQFTGENDVNQAFGVRAALSYAGYGLMSTGVMLFLAGLAAAELYSFCWRMTETGVSFLRRTRGTETGLDEPAPGETPVVPLRATPHVALMFLFALLFVVLGIIHAYDQLAEVFVMARRELGLEDQLRALFFLGCAGAVLIVVGGSYAAFRLTRIFSEALFAWECAARSLPSEMQGAFTRPIASTRFETTLRICAILSAVSLGLATVLWFSYGSTQLPGAVAWLLIMLGSLSAIFCLLWLGALRTGVYRLRFAAAAFRNRKNDTTPSGAIPALLFVISGLTLAAFGFFGFFIVIMVGFIGQMGNRPSNEPVFVYMLMALGGLLLIGGLTCGVLIVLGLVQRDLTAAAASLEMAQQRSGKSGPAQ